MKTVKSRIILLIVAMTLVLSLPIGLTLAYFSDHTGAVGGASIELGAQTVIHESTGENSKSVWIENTGDTKAVVRVAIYGPSGMTITPEEENADWVKNGDFYYYKNVLAPGETTKEGTLKAEVTLPGDGDLGDEYQIVVVQECAQAIYKLDSGVNVVTKPDGWDYIPPIEE